MPRYQNAELHEFVTAAFPVEMKVAIEDGELLCFRCHGLTVMYTKQGVRQCSTCKGAGKTVCCEFCTKVHSSNSWCDCDKAQRKFIHDLEQRRMKAATHMTISEAISAGVEYVYVGDKKVEIGEVPLYVFETYDEENWEGSAFAAKKVFLRPEAGDIIENLLPHGIEDTDYLEEEILQDGIDHWTNGDERCYHTEDASILVCWTHAEIEADK